MIKAAIILWIVFIAVKVLRNICAEAMSNEDKVIIMLGGHVPKHIQILNILLFFIALIGIVITIVGIIQY